ncbi:molybdopterin synthase catalytic subunit-like [Oppia nitens]|uniref:molybdopterin synthase catalytic subunit-like n=1 Tax=Oppia nitens TaxID=1686743 RepID=UPI0023D99489|nr:molybdopterin synthase catalytic subunit-like [Oppia nitens]
MSDHEIVTDKYVVKLVETDIDVNQVLATVSDPTCGAISLFLGQTRRTESDDQTDRRVESLVYEAYHSMALKEMQAIVERHIGKHEVNAVHKCVVVHRLGQVLVGQTSIAIACSSPHRTHGHQLVMDVLNDIKRSVPIWKRIDYYEDSDHNSHRQQQQTTTSYGEWSHKSEAFWLNK